MRKLSTAALLLDFEGLRDREEVGAYYSGSGGPTKNYGVTFSGARGRVDTDAGGSAIFANEPSPSTAIEKNIDMSLTFSAGFFGISFAYTSAFDMSVTVYNASGAVLASTNALSTGLCQRDGNPYCGDPGGLYGIWRNASLRFEGVATSARFLEAASAIFIDNIVLLLEPPPPTWAPTSTPTSAPTSVPTEMPTKVPTNAPTQGPTRAPTAPPTCNGPTHWIYDTATNAPIRRLVNNSSTCLVHPYSIEVRPCETDTLPVTIRLVRASDGRLVHRQRDRQAPFFLFGDVQGNARPSPETLPNGSYRLSSSAGGTVLFTQSCPCQKKGKKGMKGCMRK